MRRRARDRTGQKQLSVWLPAEIVDHLAAYVQAQPGRQLRLEVAAAIEKYLGALPPGEPDGAVVAG